MFRFLVIITITSFYLTAYGQPLAGSYTVGGDNPDYMTLGAAVDDLMTKGVSDAVTFNLRVGLYESVDERSLHISSQVIGAAADKRITFQPDAASGATVDNVILQHFGTTHARGRVVYIQSSFVILNELTLSWAWSDTTISGVYFASTAVEVASPPGSTVEKVTISGCKITAEASTYLPGIAVQFITDGSDIVFRDNEIKRAGSGLMVGTDESTPTAKNVTIQNNTFLGLRSYMMNTGGSIGAAITVRSGSNVSIDGNTIDYEWVNTGILGIAVWGGGFTINNNNIKRVAYQGFPYHGYTGISVTNYFSNRSVISNNVIQLLNKETVGITIRGGSNNVGIYHNTILPPYLGNCIGLELTTSSDIDVQNNIFGLTGTSNGLPQRLINVSGTPTNLTIDNNIWYGVNFRVIYMGQTYNTPEEWQATGFDQNSSFVEPEFETRWPYVDVHLGGCSIENEDLIGVPIAEVTSDMDGETRSSESPYIGADEFLGDVVNAFSSVAHYAVENIGLSFAAGDFDQDGVDDIAVVNELTNGNRDVALYWNDGNGIFSEPDHLPFGDAPVAIKAIDLDSDGLNDLVATSDGVPSVSWGMPGGAFVGPFDLPDPGTYGYVEDLGFGDLDGDGDLDIVQTHFGVVGVDSGAVTQLINEGGRSFTVSVLPAQRVGMHPSSVVMADLNGDERVDVVVNDFINSMVGSLVNLGNDAQDNWLGFEKQDEIRVSDATGIGGNSLHKNMAAGDIDGDQTIDIILGEWSEGLDSLYFLRNATGLGDFESVEGIFVNDLRKLRTFELFDYEGDGDLDIAGVTNFYEVILMRNDGFANFERFLLCHITQLNHAPMSMLFADFNSDQLPDVATLTQSPDFGVLLNNGYTVDLNNPLPDRFPVPQTVQLHQNYPNPFNPTTAISFQLSAASLVKLVIYNVLGQQVRTLVSTTQSAGSYTVNWDGRNDAGVKVASGMYFYRLSVTDQRSTILSRVKRMILMK